MTGFCSQCTALVSELNPGKICGKCRDSADNEAPDTVEIAIPFSGFYESMHSDAVDDCLGLSENEYYESKRETENNVPKEKREYPTYEELEARYDAIDWQQAHEDYSRAYVVEFSKLIKISLSFVVLTSPREYNFTTDRIFVRAPLPALISLYGKTDNEALTKKVEDRFTSRDGFSSFYNNDLAQWEAEGLQNFDHNQWETVIETYLEQTEGENWELDIMDTVRGNGAGQSQ